jgi:hypothetical protein
MGLIRGIRTDPATEAPEPYHSLRSLASGGLGVAVGAHTLLLKLKVGARFHVKTLGIYKLGFTQHYYTFASILIRKNVLSSRFH